MIKYILKKNYNGSITKQRFNNGTELYSKGISLYTVSTNEWFCDLYSPVFYDYVKAIKDIEEDKGFEIKCLNCSNTNINIKANLDYDYEENPFVDGYYLECSKCGQIQDI